MAGRIRDESIAEIREATDVVALVGEYVTLRPGGGTRMKGLCPFHQEKTPSFTVDSSRALFHCFGCGQGGDAIDFLMKQETLSFTEAVERLAHRAGIEVRYEGRSAGERGSMGRKSRLVAAHAEAVEFYHQGLDHYFITGNAQEINDLDAGVHKGWVRTGQTFKGYAIGSNGRTGRRPVCRAYGNPASGLDSQCYCCCLIPSMLALAAAETPSIFANIFCARSLSFAASGFRLARAAGFRSWPRNVI